MAYRQPLTIQSLLLSKEYFSEEESIIWCQEHNFKSGVDEKPNTFRFRQRNPAAFHKNSFRTIAFDECPGVKAVMGRLL